MKISKSTIELIPEVSFIKFEKITNQTLITAWDSPALVAQICIPGEINKDCIVNKKSLQMLKLLSAKTDAVDIEVDTTFNIKSPIGKYKGAIIVPELNFNLEFDDANATVYKYSSDIITKALEFVSTDKRRPTLTGVNIGLNGVCATDSFKLFLYGQANDVRLNDGKIERVSNVTVDATFLTKVCKYRFDEIVSNGRQVLIVDSRGLNWYSVLLQGDYPVVSQMVKNGDKLPLDLQDLKETISIAISSLDEVKEDKNKVAGYVDFDACSGEISISTSAYRNSIPYAGPDFGFRIPAKQLQIMNKLGAHDLIYLAPKKPIFVKVSDCELALFIALARNKEE